METISFYYRPSSPQNPLPPLSLCTPSTSPSIKNPKPLMNAFIIPTVAIAASALFFIRLPKNNSTPIITAPVNLEDVQEGDIKELALIQNPDSNQSLHFYKLEERAISGLIDVTEPNDYASLKVRIRMAAAWLESARVEFGDVLEKDPVKANRYWQLFDGLMEILKEMETHIDECEKEKRTGYLRSYNRLLAKVRNLEGQILQALRVIQKKDEGDD